MITFIRMKYKEIKLKLMFYTVIEKILNENKDIIKFAGNIYTALKDTPINEIQDKLITVIAENAHEQSLKDKAKK